MTQRIHEEVQPFKVAPNIIRHLIESQAGTMEKAILETVMNGLDAGATKIHIDFKNLSKIVIRDDGRGFTTREEVDKHFGVFGFDHSTDEEQAMNRKLGRFGLGRGQIMAFARTNWKTNQFEMNVDIRDKALVFKVKEHTKALNTGCVITAQLYERMSRLTQAAVIEEVKQQTRFASVPIVMDGERINTDCADVAWTTETQGFRFKANPYSEKGVEIYNLGIYVCNFPHYRLGVSGTLVTNEGHTFELNTARNDVLQSKCKLWKEVVKALRTEAKDRRASKRLSDSDRMAMLRELMWEKTNAQKYAKSALFKTVHGRYVSARQIWRQYDAKIAIAPSNMSNTGERIHNERLAAVFSPETVEWLGVKTPEEVAQKMDDMFSGIYPMVRRKCEALSFNDLAKAFKSSYEIVEREQWSKDECAAIGAIQAMADRGHHTILRVEDREQRGIGKGTSNNRKIVVGTSGSALAWTDGERYIAFDRKFLSGQLERGINGWMTLLNYLVHEMLHDSSDMSDHTHDEEFYRTFHDLSVTVSNLHFTSALETFDRYQKERKKLGLKETRKALLERDRTDKIMMGNDTHPEIEPNEEALAA